MSVKFFLLVCFADDDSINTWCEKIIAIELMQFHEEKNI